MGTNLAGSNVIETFSVSETDPNAPYINIGGANQAATLKLQTTTANVVVMEGGNAIQQFTQFITLVVAGPGKLLFQGDNTFTGSTFIDGGFVSIGSAGALGAAGVSFNNAATLEGTFTGTFSHGLTINAGATATIGAASGQTLTLTSTISVASGAVATLQFGSATDTGTINLALGSNPTLASNTALKIGGGKVVLGNAAASNLVFKAASVTLAASATLDLDGQSTTAANLSGLATSVITNSGSGATTLTTSNTADTTFAGAIDDGASAAQVVSLNLLGSATLTLSGANTYSGATTVHSGMTLEVQSADALGATASGTTVNDGATLEIEGDNLIISEPLTLSGMGVGNGGALRDDATGPNGNFLLGTITLAGVTRINDDNASGGGLEIDGTITGAFEDLTLGGAGIQFVFGAIETGAGTLTKDGTGFVQLYGTNTYTGVTTVTDGQLDLLHGQAIADTSAVVVKSPGDLFLFDSETVGSIAGNGTITLKGVTLTTGGDGTSTLFSGVIESVSSAGSLTKIGTGTQTLSGADTYTGTTTVNAGTLDIQNDAALGTTDGGTTVSSGATLEIDGDNLTIGEPLTLSGTGVGNGGALRNHDTGSSGNDLSGPITLAGAARINDDGGISGSELEIDGTIGGTNQNLTLGGVGIQFISGAIQTGSGTLTKDGAGTVHLIAADTYSGATTVSAGTLDIQDAAALGATTAGTTVANGATLEITGDNLSISEPLTLSGMGVGNGGALRDRVAGTNGNSLYGPITLAADTRINEDNGGNGGLNISGTITGNGKALTLGGAGNQFIFGAIQTGTGTLTKDGSGEIQLLGTDTYTGVTTVTAGSLDLGNGSAIADTGAVVVNGSGDLFLLDSETVGSIAGTGRITIQGVTLTTGGNSTSTTFSGVIESIGVGGLTKTGAGKLTLSGTDTYTGATALTQGTLALAGGGSIAGSAVTMSANTTLDISGTTTGTTVGDLTGAGATSNVTLDGKRLTIAGAQSAAAVQFVGMAGLTDSLVINVASQNYSLASASFASWTAGVDAITINGNALANTLTGSSQGEKIYGRAGNDTLAGGAGSDTLDGGAGADRLDGTGGTSTAAYSDATGVVTVNLLNPSSNLGDAKGDTYVNIHNVSGSLYADTVVGDNAGDTLHGLGGNDTLMGGSAGDSLFGGVGADRLVGGAGTNYLDGGAGADTLDGSGGRSYATYSDALAGLTINLATSSANTGDALGDSYINIHNVTGSSFGDTIVGDSSGDILYGKGGADTMTGGSGNDTLYGGASADRLTGGGGADRFGYLAASEGGDTITDFSTVQGDVFAIQHTGFGGGLAASGSPTASQFVTGSAATQANGQFIWNPASSTLSWDVDGTGSSAAQAIATLTGVTTLTASSIHLV